MKAIGTSSRPWSASVHNTSRARFVVKRRRWVVVLLLLTTTISSIYPSSVSAYWSGAYYVSRRVVLWGKTYEGCRTPSPGSWAKILPNTRNSFTWLREDGSGEGCCTEKRHDCPKYGAGTLQVVNARRNIWSVNDKGEARGHGGDWGGTRGSNDLVSKNWEALMVFDGYERTKALVRATDKNNTHAILT